jgi:two-component system, LytTR family, response regulator
MKNSLRTVIVDDERLARSDLRSLLASHPTVDIVGEACDVSQAVEVIRSKDPDLIFLDIQMPGGSGFDLLEKMDLRARVIFVTAFDEYAIRAFEVGAADYLLKPVNPGRLARALGRLNDGGVGQGGRQGALAYEDALVLPVNRHLRFVRVDAILCIRAADDYSEVTTVEGKKGLVQKSMAEWEARLPERHFCRIHRSTIVNIRYVERIDELPGGTLGVVLRGAETVLVASRRQAQALRHRLA